mmetsp:Transcript_1036/g.1938  ORF Transcript_1036/g.1938 Transcript_1036/m.1938 type:complete len:128 (+) Transcript_1036:1148-1531(+)
MIVRRSHMPSETNSGSMTSVTVAYRGASSIGTNDNRGLNGAKAKTPANINEEQLYFGSSQSAFILCRAVMLYNATKNARIELMVLVSHLARFVEKLISTAMQIAMSMKTWLLCAPVNHKTVRLATMR